MIRSLMMAVMGLAFSWSAQAATITILPGNGFSDQTRVSPVGGNVATTLGQARMLVFQHAAMLWGSKINSSQVIYVNVNFNSLYCTSSSGTLGWAGPNVFIKNFTNMPKLDVYYPEALANAIAGRRIAGSNPLANASTADIHAEFNSSLDSSSSCLQGVGFYYGLDNNPGNKVDLLNVVMHELAHGLGFLSFVDESTGLGGDSRYPDQLGVYDQFVYDETQAKFWTELTSAQRATSSINDGRLVWNGANVNGALSMLSDGVSAGNHVELYAPNPRESGSSVSHWNTDVSPNLIMEPFARSSMKAGLGMDLTICAMADMGWPIAPSINCPDQASTNSAPIASAQSLQTAVNTQLAITLTGSDANADALTYAIVTAPTQGQLTGTAPNVIYIPNSNYTGTDSFIFVVNDGKVGSKPAKISLTIGSTSGGGSAGGGSENSSGGGGGGAMPNLLWLLVLLGFKRLKMLKANRS